MESQLDNFERISRQAFLFTSARIEAERSLHPFEERNVHQALPNIVRKLFDNGHFSNATFEAFKFVDKEIQRHSSSSESGFKLMMQVLSETNPVVTLTPCKTVSEKDEQKGFQFLFAGSMLAIRNPRGHEYDIVDTVDVCLDHLGLASLLLRRLENAGYKVQKK